MSRQRFHHRPSASLPVVSMSSPLRYASFSALAHMMEEEFDSDRSTPSSASSDFEDSDSEESSEAHGLPIGEQDDEDSDGIAWGHPLQRMVTLRRPTIGSSEAAFSRSTYSSSTFPVPEAAGNNQDSAQVHYLTFDDEYNSSDEDESESGLFSPARSDIDDSESETSSVDWTDIDFNQLVDDLLSLPDFELPTDPSLISPHIWPAPHSSNAKLPPTSFDSFIGRELQVLPFLVTSPTLYFLLHFNQDDIRLDPWNPIPRIIGVAERTLEGNDYVFLLTPQLDKFDNPPLLTVANWVDFLRQSLEALAFMHEQDVVRLLPTIPSLDSTSSFPAFTVDTGYPPPSLEQPFDRTRYPVRYYLDLHALSATSLPPSVSYGIPKPTGDGSISDLAHEKVEDVKRWGEMIESAIQEVSPLSKKLAPLISSMKSGEFTAENARKLFEGLCWGMGER